MTIFGKNSKVSKKQYYINIKGRLEIYTRLDLRDIISKKSINSRIK